MKEVTISLLKEYKQNQLLNYLLHQKNDLDKEIINKLISKLEVND